MAQVTLIFNDAQGAPQLSMAFADSSPPARLSDGRSIPAAQVQVGDWVVIPDHTVRRVDAVEIGA